VFDLLASFDPTLSVKSSIYVWIFSISKNSSPKACFCVPFKHLVEINLKLLVKFV
jgi:hypothetical protein